MCLSNSTKNPFVTSSDETEARRDWHCRSTGRLKSEVILTDRVCANDSTRETNSCRIPTDPIRPKNLEQSGAKCRLINRSITDTAASEKVFGTPADAALRHYYATPVSACMHICIYACCIGETKARASRCIKPG